MDISKEIELFAPFLEIIAPDGGEELQSILIKVLEETGGLSELLLLQEVALKKALFAVEDDIYELIQQIRLVGSYWEANLLSASNNEEEESVLYQLEPEDLLKISASELNGYGLQLWQIEDDRLTAGFIARENDEDLILNFAPLLRLNFKRIPCFLE